MKVRKRTRITVTERQSFWLGFLGKTALYFGIMLALVYLYHFSHVSGGGFIYNQF